MSAAPLVTPDGRYLVVRGRLWRRTDPRLDEATRASLIHELMEARRAKKTALADDDAPDETRRMARNTRYADWFATVGPDAATN